MFGRVSVVFKNKMQFQAITRCPNPKQSDKQAETVCKRTDTASNDTNTIKITTKATTMPKYERNYRRSASNRW